MDPRRGGRDPTSISFDGAYHNLRSVGYSETETAVAITRHLTPTTSATLQDPGYATTTEAPVRSAPRVKTTPNMLSRHGVTCRDLPTRGDELDPPMGSRGLTASDALSSFTAARRMCQLALDEITVRVHRHRQATQNVCAKYLDVLFFVSDKDSLFPQGAPPDSRVGIPSDVARLAALYPNVPVVRYQSPSHSLGNSGTDDSNTAAADTEDDDTGDDARVFDELAVGELSDFHFVSSVIAMQCAASRDLLPRLIVLPRSPEVAERALATIDRALEELRTHSDVSRHAEEGQYDEDPHPQPHVQLDIGAVGVLLYVDGAWSWVIVDDTVPLSQHGTPLFARLTPRAASAHERVAPSPTAGSSHVRRQQSSAAAAQPQPPTELLPMLLEKALAKQYRSYDSIDGGVVREMLGALTAGFEFRVRLQPRLAATTTTTEPLHRSRSRAMVASRHASKATLDDDAPCVDYGPPSTVPENLGADDAPMPTGMHPRGRSEHMPHMTFAAFEEKCIARLGTRMVAVALSGGNVSSHRARAAVVQDASAADDDFARRLLVQSGGWPYPVVRCWRSKIDKEGRVELYDPWSSSDSINTFNLGRAQARRKARLVKLAQDVQHGHTTEESFRLAELSHFTVRTGSAGRFFTVSWSLFTELFDSVEGVHVIPDLAFVDSLPKSRRPTSLRLYPELATLSNYHCVIGCSVAPATVRNDGGVLLQDPVSAFVVRIQAPVTGLYFFALTQADPKADTASDHYTRKTKPYATIAFSLYHFGKTNPNRLITQMVSSRTAVGLHTTLAALRAQHQPPVIATPATYARQVSAAAELDAGYYLAIPVVTKAPETPFAFSVTASSAAVLSLARLSLPMCEKSVLSDVQHNVDKAKPPDVASLLASSPQLADATIATLDRLRSVITGAPTTAAVDADLPVAYRRARQIREAGGYVTDLASTFEADGSVSTRRLARPSDFFLPRRDVQQ